MVSTRPYLLRGFYDWIVDSQCTPYIIVDATYPGVQVPQEYINDGKVVLNISPTAVRELALENRMVRFLARFDGEAQTIVAPVRAVLAIYAQENGRGMVFNEDEDSDPPIDGDEEGKPKRPNLQVVK